MKERLGRWLKRGGVVLALGIPAAAAFGFLGIEISSRPAFCGSCHFMTPYYESWKTSTHKEVACIECHIPPGIASEFRKKYEALAMVARYFTGTYSTNPWAEVDDQSCLRSGCHTKRVLLGKEVYLGGVLFDHQPHLSEMRREKQLRCTSCHSQIVQGSHISVTPSTCFLCHFKDTQPNTGSARCTLCHAIPDKTITTAGLSFDHGDVKRFNMQCMSCHEGVVKGEGNVLRERCFTCHNDEKRIVRFGETEFLHRQHVTDHKIECLNCHIEIVHKVPAREEAIATPCASCHSPEAGHSAVRDLYRGIGGKGVEPRPAAMYLAGVRCEACHNVAHGQLGKASEVSCMSCHGPDYLVIYRTWQAGIGVRLNGVKSELAQAQKILAGKDGAALAEAAANVALVEEASGIHNPGYARALLESAHRSVAGALEAAGQPPPLPPWPQAPYESKCLECHFGIEQIAQPAFGKPFPHGTHVVTARLRCEICHTSVENHGGVTIAAADCESCHTRTAGRLADLPSEQCLGCHSADIGAVSQKVKFPHEHHIASGLDCETCHSQVGEMPHRRLAHSDNGRPKFEHAFCGTCHAADVPTDGEVAEGADCTKCHIEF